MMADEMNTDEFVSPIHDKYPVIISKMDPLIIRVEPLTLLVGSTTYSAKIKLGIKYDGFYIYCSDIGEPIYKEPNVNQRNKDNGKGLELTNPLYKLIFDEAVRWIDFFEYQYKETNEKNIVDLLREIKFQNHFDLTGYLAGDIEQYPNLELDSTTPTYIHDILKQLTEINVKLNNLNSTINGGNIEAVEVSADGKDINIVTVGSIDEGLNQRVTNFENTMDTDMSTLYNGVEDVKNSVDSLNSALDTDLKAIDISIQNGYATVANAVGVMNTHIGKFVDNDGNLTYQAATMLSDVETTKINVSNMVTTVNGINTLVTTIDNNVGHFDAGSGTLQTHAVTTYRLVSGENDGPIKYSYNMLNSCYKSTGKVLDNYDTNSGKFTPSGLGGSQGAFLAYCAGS